jgi:hypothetical protein
MTFNPLLAFGHCLLCGALEALIHFWLPLRGVPTFDSVTLIFLTGFALRLIVFMVMNA